VLVDTCVRGLLGAPNGRHAADFVVGLALLGLPARRGVWEGLNGRLGDVSTEDVSSLSWAWERLMPAEPVPGFLREAVEGEPYEGTHGWTVSSADLGPSLETHVSACSRVCGVRGAPSVQGCRFVC
jgi:hypothetical protein